MVDFKTRLLGYRHDFVKFKNNLKIKIKNSQDLKDFGEMCGQVFLFALLGGMTYLALVSNNILIKFVGIGTGLYLLESKIVPMVSQVLGSLTLSKHYK